MAEELSQTEMIERAHRAALSVATTQGLKVENAKLLHFGCNATIRLYPYDIVARVSGRAGGFSSHAAARQREIDVSRYLADAGAPVVSPSSMIDAGLHEEDGVIVSFWEYIEASESRRDRKYALDALHRCHEILADYPGELPFLHGYADARRLFLRYWRLGVLAGEEIHETLERISEMDHALEIMKENMPSPPVPIHGDSHFANVICIANKSGVFWIDWEDVSCGPVEWDYACMMRFLADHPVRDFRLTRAFKAAIADRIDPERFELMIEARELQSDLWDMFP